LVSRMSTSPAHIARYSEHGNLAIGTPANVVLIDLTKDWIVDRGALHSKSRNTPFHEMTLPGVIEKTFHNGALVFDRKAAK
jgi:dihydroorotase